MTEGRLGAGATFAPGYSHLSDSSSSRSQTMTSRARAMPSVSRSSVATGSSAVSTGRSSADTANFTKGSSSFQRSNLRYETRKESSMGGAYWIQHSRASDGSRIRVTRMSWRRLPSRSRSQLVISSRSVRSSAASPSSAARRSMTSGVTPLRRPVAERPCDPRLLSLWTHAAAGLDGPRHEIGRRTPPRSARSVRCARRRGCSPSCPRG